MPGQHPIQRFQGASRWPHRLASMLLFAALLCAAGGRAAAEDGPPPPTPLFGIKVGGEGVVFADGIGPALGLRLGLRVDPRVAIIADGHVAAMTTDAANWNLLGGVRLHPVLQRHVHLDLDVLVGYGKSGALAQGRYMVDGVDPMKYPILRVEGSLLGSVSTRVGIGPRLRYEIQPVFVREIGHMPDGSEDITDRMRIRGHQVMLAIAFEADAPEGIGHVSWDFGGGVAISGDGEEAGAILRGMFTWFLDSRPGRSAPVRQEVTP